MTHPRRMLRPWLLAALLALIVGGMQAGELPRGLAATTIAVTTFDDELNADGDCSLREAIRAANTDAAVDACPAGSGADTIVLDAGTYLLTITGVEDEGIAGDLDITSDLTIVGQGSGLTSVEGIGSTPERIFDVRAGAAASFESFAVRYGAMGILNNGTLTVESMAILSSQGVGVESTLDGAQQVRLFVNDSLIGSHGGYGIYLEAVTCCAGSSARVEATITNSHLSWNAYGIYIHHRDGFAHATIVNTTIRNSWGGGTGVFARGFGSGHSSAEIISSTIVDNKAGISSGSNSDSGTDSMTIKNSILSNNKSGSTPRNCGSLATRHTITSLGGNIVSDGTCAGVFVQAGDQRSTDPLLGPLGDHGGATLTYPLLDGSPAIDAVPVGDCVDQDGVALAVDQRGQLRPSGAACDAGAFELQVGPAPLELVIAEGIGIADSAVPVPPLVLFTSEGVGVGTSALPVPPLVLFASEGVGVGTTALPVPPLVLTIGDAVGVGSIVIAEVLFPDDDGDGIQNELDGHTELINGVPTFVSDAHVFSDAFGDSQTGGTTRGVILNRAGLHVVIADLAGAQGVRLEAGAGPGIADVAVCGGAAVVHPVAGTVTTATCGSVTLQVLVGPVTAELVGAGGRQATVTLGAGQALTFFPESMTVTTPAGQGAITLLIDGRQLTVAGGQTVLAILSPRSVMRFVLDVLRTHEADAKKLRNAVNAMERALGDRAWIDDWHVDAKGGRSVFEHAAQAARQIDDALSERGKKALPADATATLARARQALVDANRVLARTLIEEAASVAAVDPLRQPKVDRALAKAAEALARGDAQVAAGKPDKAIDEYGKAWEHATDALRERQRPAKDQNADLDRRRDDDHVGEAERDGGPDAGGEAADDADGSEGDEA